VIKSDLFERVDGKFDLIIIDPPFRWTKPRSWLEKASADQGYRTLNRFFSEAKSHLSRRGRIILNFGTSADVRYLRHLTRNNCFNSNVISRIRNKRVGWTYYVFKLTTK
jgi:release factor glutamine methyltransferase